MLGAGCWVLGAGCWVLGAGCWVLTAENGVRGAGVLLRNGRCRETDNILCCYFTAPKTFCDHRAPILPVFSVCVCAYLWGIMDLHVEQLVKNNYLSVVPMRYQHNMSSIAICRLLSAAYLGPWSSYGDCICDLKRHRCRACES